MGKKTRLLCVLLPQAPSLPQPIIFPRFCLWMRSLSSEILVFLPLSPGSFNDFDLNSVQETFSLRPWVTSWRITIGFIFAWSSLWAFGMIWISSFYRIQVMLGPVLDEVISWICDTDSIIPPSAEQSSENYSSIGGLAGLLAGKKFVKKSSLDNRTRDYFPNNGELSILRSIQRLERWN